MKGIHKLTVALLTVVAISTWNTTFATSMTIDVEGTDSASHSGAISVGTLNKINAGALALSGTNAIGALGIHGGLVSVSAASNLNGASSAVTFAASGTDPVTSAANTATLEIAGSMNTGAFAFSTAGTVQVDSTYTATLNAAPTGTGLVHKTGAGVMKVASDLSASAALAGINVDAGTLYVQSGKAPNAPIQIASGAALQLAGVDESAESQISSAITVQLGGSIVVDADVSVSNALTSTVTYTFDTADGYYKNGSTPLAWPSNFGAVVSDFSTYANWHELNGTPHFEGLKTDIYTYYTTNNTTATGLQYGGASLTQGYLHDHSTGFQQYFYRIAKSSSPYNQSVSNGMDAALSGTVLMQSGSSIVLGAGSNWARNITVGTAS